MLNNLVAIDSDIFFERSAVRNTRGNSMKLDKQHFISNRDGQFFITVSLIRGIRSLIMSLPRQLGLALSIVLPILILLCNIVFNSYS